MTLTFFSSGLPIICYHQVKTLHFSGLMAGRGEAGIEEGEGVTSDKTIIKTFKYPYSFRLLSIRFLQESRDRFFNGL